MWRSLCFSTALNRALSRSLRWLPALRCVGTLRELPDPTTPDDETKDDGGGRTGGTGEEGNDESRDESGGDEADSTARAQPPCTLQLAHQLHVPMSWAESTKMHIYCCERAGTLRD